MKLQDLKIIVTGAASGMGAHFAKELHAAGAKVAALEGAAPQGKPATFGDLLDWTLGL